LLWCLYRLSFKKLERSFSFFKKPCLMWIACFFCFQNFTWCADFISLQSSFFRI
jgi:hypothetical protein